MLNCLIVGIGGFLGSVARYLIGVIPIKDASGFPFNTLLINVIGAFLIGIIAAVSLKNQDMNPRIILLVKVGLCGGFTTFSTFSLETLNLFEAGTYMTAVIYAVCSVVLCVLATLSAQVIMR